MQNFFITGLPRSRTAWLANFLTYNVSFCWHDALSFCKTPQGLWEFLCQQATSSGYDYLGSADSAFVLRVDEMTKCFPEAKWVIVKRSRHEAAVSFWRYFGSTYHEKSPQTWDETVSRFLKLEDALVNTMIALPKAVVVDFKELDCTKVIRKVWVHCLPNLPFPEERWRMLNTMKVNVIPEKVVFA